MNIAINKNKLYSNDKSLLKLDIDHCKILHCTNNYLILKSPMLNQIYSKVIHVEKKFDINERCVTLEEEGIVMKLHYINNVSFNELLDKQKIHNISCNIHSIENSKLLFKIIKITNENEKNNENDQNLDIPEPDVRDIQQYLCNKVKKFKGKLNEIDVDEIQRMNLTELILFEDNLHDFFQNNI